MVLEEVSRLEQEHYLIKAVSRPNKGMDPFGGHHKLGHPIVTTRRELVHASSLKTSPACSWIGMEEVDLG